MQRTDLDEGAVQGTDLDEERGQASDRNDSPGPVQSSPRRLPAPRVGPDAVGDLLLPEIRHQQIHVVSVTAMRFGGPMRILVLGGTVFLSRAVAEAAVARGHDVTCAARGVSGTVPDGATLVPWDRADAVPADLTTTPFDAVVDVSRIPSHVRSAVAAFPDAHWTFVSTINVYADTATPGGTPATLPLLDPIETDEDPASGPETYGAMKVACENTVRTGVAAALVIRPGLIVGPGDPSGRFTYWPVRFAEAARDGLPVLVPEPVDAPVQLVDVRDLAEWIVTAAEAGTTGDFDAVSPPVPRSELLAQVADGAGVDPERGPALARSRSGPPTWSTPASWRTT
jgi:2'-hydroxyisoflavone reductase